MVSKNTLKNLFLFWVVLLTHIALSHATTMAIEKYVPKKVNRIRLWIGITIFLGLSLFVLYPKIFDEEFEIPGN